MHITIDNFATYIGLAGALLATAIYLVLAFVRSDGRPTRLSRTGAVGYLVSLGSLLYSFVFLLQQLVGAHRYDIAYIFLNSGPSDQAVYRVSSLWAGQQGSLLLWAVMTGLIGLVFIYRIARTAPAVTAFWCSIQVFFLTLLAVDDIFKPLSGFQPGMVGSGLNPLLKNPWMAIHPPVVFLGYALLLVPGAFAIAALLKGDVKRWADRSLPWALFGWVSLTAGLALGMIWSYEVLGWGGFWGWDPVENASLVPWLTSTALVHGLVLQRYRGRMARTNIVMALATFLLVLYATFLTRSGVLSSVSVHSFADTPAFKYLEGFTIFYAVLCLIVLAARWRSASTAAQPINAKSRDFVTTVGTVLLLLFAAVVLVGTSYPLFAKGAIQPQFYNRMSAPLAVLIATLLAVAPLTRWTRRDGATEYSPKLPWVGAGLALVAVVALAAGAVALGSPDTLRVWSGWLVSPDATGARLAVQGLLLLLGAAAIAVIVSAVVASRTSPTRAGAYVAHAGVALLLIGIVFSSAGRSTTLDLQRGGASSKAFGYSFAYAGMKSLGHNKDAMMVSVSQGGRSFKAPLFIQYSDRGAVRSPYIKSSLAGDLYISPVDLELVKVTPTASMGDTGWMAIPAKIPGTDVAVSLVGMQVESHKVVLEFVPPNGKPKEFSVTGDQPATVDGYTFSFEGFSGSGMDTGANMTVGATLAVTGPGLDETAVISVSRKPMIWLVWLGSALIILGGIAALLRRRAENAKAKDGILPDTSGSD